jgi:TPP-dependent 2-oxoacid decarboxylase
MVLYYNDGMLLYIDESNNDDKCLQGVVLDTRSSQKFTIGNYLGTRFEQIGIKHCFMVPGEHNLVLLFIFVSGGYNTNDEAANHLIHHTIGTHDFSYQYEIFRQVTCAAVRILNAENAPLLIDHAIVTALRERKPAYIEIACNLAAAPCNKPAPFREGYQSTFIECSCEECSCYTE